MIGKYVVPIFMLSFRFLFSPNQGPFLLTYSLIHDFNYIRLHLNCNFRVEIFVNTATLTVPFNNVMLEVFIFYFLKKIISILSLFLGTL
jgi:hypothetical protein